MTIGAFPLGLAPLGGAGTTSLVVDSGLALAAGLMISTDYDLPISDTDSLVITQVAPLGDTLNFVVNRPAPLSSGVGIITRDTSLPTSAFLSVARNAALPLALGRTFVLDVSVPLSDAISLVANRASPMGALLNVISTAALPDHALLNVAATGALPTSLTGALVLLVDSGVPTSFVSDLARDAALPSSSSVGLVLTRVAPLGDALGVRTDFGDQPIGTGLLVAATTRNAFLSLSGVSVDAHAPELTQAHLSVDLDSPVAGRLALALDSIVPVASLLTIQLTAPKPMIITRQLIIDESLALAATLYVSVEVESSMPISTILEVYIPVASDAGVPFAASRDLVATARVVVTAPSPPDATSLYVLIVPGGS